MEYNKDTIIGDVTTYEVFEGTPQEIIELVEGLEHIPETYKQYCRAGLHENKEGEETSVLDISEELIKFIQDKTNYLYKDIETVLKAWEEYIGLKKLIKDWK